jgi:hypothetical protein
MAKMKKSSKFNAYEILNSIHRYQESYNKSEYNDDLVIKGTIAMIESLRTDMKMRHQHECSPSYCCPLDILTFFTPSKCSGKYNTEVHVCKYGQVHICNHLCPARKIDSETIVCPITNKEKINISTFAADSEGVTSYDEQQHNSKRRLKSLYEEHLKQDEMYNEPYRNRGYNKIKKMADRANKTIKKIAHRKKPKVVKKIVFTSKQKYETLERWINYCTHKTEFGLGYFISTGCKTLLDDFADIEKIKISMGEMRIYNAIKDDISIPKAYIDMIKAFEDVLEKVLPGIFRLSIEEKFIETILRCKYSIANNYLHECKAKKVIPNIFNFFKLINFSIERHHCVLTNWCTWEDWCTYIHNIVHWWFICENAIVSDDDQKCKSLDYTQHALSVLYMMRDGMNIAEQFDPRIIHFLIAKDCKLSNPDYLMRINRLTACGIIRKSYNIGCRTLKGCIDRAMTNVPIKELTL